MRHLPIQIYGNNKLCFINKVREEHVQIIDLINTRGAQSVINPVNKIRGVYIYTADLPLFIDLFPASLRHPFSALTIISFLTCRGGRGLGDLGFWPKFRARSLPLGQLAKYA